MISPTSPASQLIVPSGVRLSLCMIVRDSSRTLVAALSSIRPYVDEMIVVDTGSLDDTPEIARRLGAQVFHFPWCDDFSAARNESLNRAAGDWLFWMDSDDTIDAANGRKLRELADRPLASNPLAYVMQVHCPGTQDDGQLDVTVVDHVKMFRNLLGLRFEGRIHEQVLPAIRRLGGDIGWTDIFVTHSGSDQSPQGRQRKQQRDLRLIELELQDKPDHPFGLFNLGMTYNDMGWYEQAVAALRRCLQVSTTAESHVRKAYALLACSLTQLERWEEAAETCRAGLLHFASDPELHFRAGLVAHRLGQLENAVSEYRQVFAARSERHFSSLDRGIIGYKARHNLAVVYGDMGRHDLAELQWRLAISDVPEYKAAWRGLGESLFKQQRFTTAEVEIERLQGVEPLRSEAQRLHCELAYAKGDILSAAREFAEAAKSLPGDLDLLRARCQFLFSHGEPETAEQALLDLCERTPDDGGAHHNLGTLYLKMGRINDAVACYRRSLAVRPNYQLTMQHLECARAQLNKLSNTPLRNSCV